MTSVTDTALMNSNDSNTFGLGAAAFATAIVYGVRTIKESQ